MPNEIRGFFVKYRFLSNFWPAKVYDDMMIEYESVETAYQACKSLNFDVRLGISKLTAAMAKKNSKAVEVENTWGDTFWGICDNKGKNILGIILMEVRDSLKK